MPLQGKYYPHLLMGKQKRVWADCSPALDNCRAAQTQGRDIREKGELGQVGHQEQFPPGKGF